MSGEQTGDPISDPVPDGSWGRVETDLSSSVSPGSFFLSLMFFIEI
jgi:hypothetical protein